MVQEQQALLKQLNQLLGGVKRKSRRTVKKRTTKRRVRGGADVQSESEIVGLESPQMGSPLTGGKKKRSTKKRTIKKRRVVKRRRSMRGGARIRRL